MRFSSVFVLALAAAVIAASPSQAQRRRQTPRTPQVTTQVTTPPTPGQPEAASRDQEARMLFEAGRVAYAAGRFEDALGYFQRAHEISGRAVLLYNVASAADKLRRDAIALDAFRRYLEAVPTAENRAEVESRIHVLEGVVAADQARVVPTVTVPTEPLTPAVTPESADGRAGGGDGDAQRNGEVAASLQVGAGGDDGVRQDRGSGIFGQWWFWTIVGVVVVGGTVAAILAATSGGGLGPFQTGDDGRVYMTLGMP